jgi:hypothetical protein
MSDAAPAVAVESAPVETQGTESVAVAQGGQAGARGAETITGETGKGGAKPAAKPPADDFKTMRVKAGGKEHEITSRAQLERILQRGIPVQGALEELASERARIEPVLERLKALAEGDDDSAMGILEELMGDGRFSKLAEKRLMREVEREKKLSGYTERERQMAAQLEQAQAQRSQWERQQAEAKQSAEKQRSEAGIRQASEHIAQTVGGALESLGLPRDLGPQALAMVRPLVAASVAAGQPLDPASLAEELKGQLEQSVQWAASKLQGKALLDFFGPSVGKAYKAALLEQMRGGSAVPVVPANGAAPAHSTEPAGVWNPRRREWVGSGTK